jgi:hypothetical protein
VPSKRRIVFIADSEDAEPVIFTFKIGRHVGVYINDTTVRPMLVDYLDEDCVPFRIRCPDQHEGNCFTIIHVERVEEET